MFQKRHLDAIAATIKDIPIIGPSHKAVIANEFYLMARESNPRVDKERFMKACGL